MGYLEPTDRQLNDPLWRREELEERERDADEAADEWDGFNDGCGDD